MFVDAPFTIFPPKYYVDYCLDCSHNYSTSYWRSQIDKIIDFELRISDINKQIDIVCVDNNLFRVEITLVNQYYLLYCFQNHKMIRNRFINCDSFI